jgi:hypothetical protein
MKQPKKDLSRPVGLSKLRLTTDSSQDPDDTSLSNSAWLESPYKNPKPTCQRCSGGLKNTIELGRLLFCQLTPAETRAHSSRVTSRSTASFQRDVKHKQKVTESNDLGNSKNRSHGIGILNVSPTKLRNALQSAVNSLYCSAMIWLTPTRNGSSVSAGSAAVCRSEFCACCMPIGTDPAET